MSKDVTFATNVCDGVKTDYHLDLYIPTEQGEENSYYSYEDFSEEDSSRGKEDYQKGRGNFPVVVFVHGGGWRRGGRQAWKHFLYTEVNLLAALIIWFLNTYSNVGKAFARDGIACAVISYPLTDLQCPYLFAELLSSYIGCCMMVLLTLTPLVIVTSVYTFLVHSTHFPYWVHTFQDLRNFDSTSVYVLSFLILVNLLILGLFTLRRSDFKLGNGQVLCMWTVVFVTVFLTRHITAERQLAVLFVTSLGLVQGKIFRQRLSRTSHTYVDQANVVAKAVKWVKDFADETGSLDSRRIVLMGHSAGGHLVSLITLDHQFLTRVGCSPSDIKGVISLSGVYNLLCLDSALLRQFYLFPTFGRHRKCWVAASPTHLLGEMQETKACPPFLLMCAERDLMLQKHSYEFWNQLVKRGIQCDHFQIPGTNHFTIITNLSKSYKHQSVYELCCHFVKTT